MKALGHLGVVGTPALQRKFKGNSMSSDFTSTVSMSLIEFGEEDKPWLGFNCVSSPNSMS
jgi:hypothetical protein